MRQWRAITAAVLVAGAIAGVVLAALVADGRVGSESETNAGGAWLLNRSESSIGHVNRVVGEVDTTAGPFTGAFDVAQAPSVVVVNNRGTGQAVLIDTNLAQPGAPVVVSSTTEVYAAPGVVVLSDPAVGAVWRFSREEFGTVQTLEDAPPTIQASPGAATAVGREGTVIAADAGAGVIHVLRPGGVSEPLAVEDWGDAEISGATLVGSTPVVILDDGRVLVVRDGGTVETFNVATADAVWQQPSEEGTALVGIGPDGTIIELELASGVETSAGSIVGSSPTPPIVHDGCVWVVTTVPVPALHYCGVVEELPAAGGELKLTLVNGWVWVNDVNQGGIWFVREDQLEIEEVTDWSAALNLTDSEDELDENAGGEEELVENAAAEDLSDKVDELDEDDQNTPPVAVDDQGATRRGRAVVIDVLANDYDDDNDPLSIDRLLDVDAGGAVASGAVVSVTPDGASIQVVPSEDFVGEIRFGYVVDDGRGGQDDATVRLDVTEPDQATNRPPVTVDDNATVRAGRSVTLNVLTNDSDPDGDVLVLTSVEGETGSVNFTPDGQVSFAPDVTSAEGTIVLTYLVEDDFRAEASGTIRVRVRVANSNQPPQARNDVGTTSVGRPVILNVLANDMDPDGDPLSVQNLQPVDAPVTTAQLAADGRFLFRPEAPGTYRFTYTLSDGPEIDQAQIRIDVDEQQPNRPPVAVVDEIALAAGEGRLVRVLDNDGDPDGDIVGIVEWSPAPPGLEVTEVPGIGFTVRATATAEPRTTFRYWISDGIAEPVRGFVVVSVIAREPVDYPPVAAADSVDVRAGQTSELFVLRNDYDPEGQFLRLVGPLPALSEGLLRLSPDRQALLLTVNDDQQFGFQFSYDVEDPAGNRASAVVDVRIVNRNQPNRAPVAGPDVARTAAAMPVSIPVLANDFDPDGDPITIESIAEQPRHGTVTVEEDGSVTYTPVAGFAGTDSFVYTLVDGYQAPADSTLPADQRGQGRDLGEVYVGVMPEQAANRPPIAVDDVGFPPVSIGDQPVLLDVLRNDSDPDGDELRITETVGVAVGDVRLVNNGRAIEYAPPSDGAPREIGFTYSIADGRGGVASAQVLLELATDPASLPPEATDDTVGPVKAGEVVVFDPRENDIDPDGDRADLVIVPQDPQMTVEPDGRVRLVAPLETTELPYLVRDVQGLESEVAFVTVLVTENRAPDVEPIAVETPYDTPITIDLHDAVTDPDEDPLVITLGRNRSGGSVTVDGSPADSFLRVVFTPDTGFEGTATFDFTADDRAGHIVAGAVTVNVLPPENRPPVAAPITVRAEAGVPSLVRLSDSVSDPDPDGAANHTFEISAAANGNVTLDGPTAAGEVWIRSTVDGGGVTDSFSYTVVDGEFTSTETVTIDLAIPNFPPPSLTDDVARILQGNATPPISLLANDVDNSPAALRGDGLVVTAVGVSPDGTTQQVANTAIFTPDPDFYGTASFTYTVQDGRRSVEGESTGTVTVQVIGRPDTPQPPTITTIGNRYLIVGWSAPQGNEARAPVSGYVLEYTAANGATGSIEFDRPTTSYRWENLTNAVEYCFRIAAVNEAGQGEFSELGECASPDVRPETPNAPSIEFGDTELTVNWTPPLNQGSPILNYQVRISGGTVDVSAALGVATSYTWTGLENGTGYAFQVRAQNSALENEGWSEWSTLSAPEHPLTVPDAPAQPTAVRGDRQVEITWSAPYDGGDTITRYQVRSSISPTWVDVTPQGVSNTHTWENIPNGTNVSFQVRAVNRDARSTTPGNISPPSPVVRTCSVPDAPGQPTVVRGDTQVTVNWVRPNDQGCAIGEYRITSSAGGTQTASAAATSHVFTGLTNGTAYTFTVTAINEVVTVDGVTPSASPASASITPFGPPFATNVTAATNVGVRQVQVTWAAPNANGSPITNYEMSINGGPYVSLGTTATSVTRTEPTNGATYSYRVRAVNAAGPSTQVGAQGTVTTWNVPGTPSVSASNPADRQIRGTWNNPANGGTGFTAQETQLTTGACTGGGGVGVGTTSQTWGSLAYSTNYAVCVRYANAVGWGPWGSATARTNSPPVPVVSIGLGGPTTGGSCSDNQGCYWLNISMSNFPSGSSVRCYGRIPGGWTEYGSFTAGNGSHTACAYSYAGRAVVVAVNGTISGSDCCPSVSGGGTMSNIYVPWPTN